MEVPSDSGITFNVQPKMKALEIAEKARDAILSKKFDQVLGLIQEIFESYGFVGITFTYLFIVYAA